MAPAQLLFLRCGGTAESTVENLLSRGVNELLTKAGFKKRELYFGRRLNRTTQYIWFQPNEHQNGQLFVNAMLSLDELCVQDKQPTVIDYLARNVQFSWRLEQFDQDVPRWWQLGVTTDLTAVANEIMKALQKPLATLDTYDSAQKVLELYKFPENTVDYFLRARVKHSIGDFDGAREDFELACKLSPDRDFSHLPEMWNLTQLKVNN